MIIKIGMENEIKFQPFGFVQRHDLNCIVARTLKEAKLAIISAYGLKLLHTGRRKRLAKKESSRIKQGRNQIFR